MPVLSWRGRWANRGRRAVRPLRDCIFTLAVLTIAGSAHAQNTTPTSYTIFVQGRNIGSETLVRSRTAQGWTLSGSGRLMQPVDISTGQFEMRYDEAWKPLELSIETVAGTQKVSVQLKFQGLNASGQIAQATDIAPYNFSVPENTIVLTDTFFGAYDALAGKLAGATVGTEIPCLLVRQAIVIARVTAVADERIQTPSRTLAARRYRISLVAPAATIETVLWADENHRLLRLAVANSGLEVVREDIATVASRQQTVTRTGDEQVRISAAGFTLGATVSRPPTPPPPRGYPAIILVPGSGEQDRDGVIAGVPVFGHLANQLADAGSLVVRYDKRAVGLSGGRAEAVTLGDYAEDVRAIVKFLEDRRDVDDDRVALLGYGDGGWIALMTAAREGDIDAVVLAATPGVAGAELVLEQQRQMLAALKLSDQESQAKIELQKKINAAVATGAGWEELPPDVRRQADTPWFQSLLTFDPAQIMRRVEQPVLVVQAELDREVPAAHGQRLIELARQRKARRADLVTVPGINHLLAEAVTGEVGEYQNLRDKSVSTRVTAAIAEWLKLVFAPAGARSQ